MLLYTLVRGDIDLSGLIDSKKHGRESKTTPFKVSVSQQLAFQERV